MSRARRHGHFANFRRTLRRKRGIALLMTLIITTLYLIIAYHYIYLTTTYNKIGQNQRDEVAAMWGARGGVYYARAQLALDKHLDIDSVDERYLDPISLEGKDASKNTTVDVKISDESGKFNILMLLNDESLSDEQRQLVRDIFERLIFIARRDDDRLRASSTDDDDLDPLVPSDDIRPGNLADNIRDYLEDRGSEDGDDASFAKDDDGIGRRKQSPFPIMTINELLQVEGMTEDILFGKDSPTFRRPKEEFEHRDLNNEFIEDRYDPDANEIYDPSGQLLSGQESEEFQRGQDGVANEDDEYYSRYPLNLTNYLTIWGDGKININTANPNLLLALSESLTYEMVEDLRTVRSKAKQDADRIANDDIESPDTTTDPLPSDESGEDGEAEDEPPKGFRVEDIVNVVAFYNRLQAELEAAEGEEDTTGVTEGEGQQPAVQSEEEVPIEWREAFADMQPFLTVRSNYFRVVSKATVDASKKSESGGEESKRKNQVVRTYIAVFRRDQVAADTNNNNNVDPNNPGPVRGDQPGANTDPFDSNRYYAYEAGGSGPPETGLRLSLIYLNESQ